jgi:hypothetical protein
MLLTALMILLMVGGRPEAWAQPSQAQTTVAEVQTPQPTVTPSPDEPLPVPQQPTPTPIPPTKDVRAAARKAGFGDAAEAINRGSRSTVLYTDRGRALDSAPLGSSRIGGAPDLPKGERWPRCNGQPQTFLAQVRVRDLPSEGRELRRLGGSLLFFTSVELEGNEDSYGIWAGDCSKVIHARHGVPLRRTSKPRRGVLDIPATRLRFTGRPDIPPLGAGDRVLPPLHDLTVTDWEAWYRLRDAIRGGTDSAHLLGYSDTPNGDNSCSARAERPKTTWRHLFTFWDWEVADGGRLQLLIAPADLARGRFDRVCGIFDSA